MKRNHGAPYESRTRLFRLKISREPQRFQYVVQSYSAEATQVIPMGYKAGAKRLPWVALPISESAGEATWPNARSRWDQRQAPAGSAPAGASRLAGRVIATE